MGGSTRIIRGGTSIVKLGRSLIKVMTYSYICTTRNGEQAIADPSAILLPTDGCRSVYFLSGTVVSD